jgi:hypothetical protein
MTAGTFIGMGIGNLREKEYNGNVAINTYKRIEIK